MCATLLWAGRGERNSWASKESWEHSRENKQRHMGTLCFPEEALSGGARDGLKGKWTAENESTHSVVFLTSKAMPFMCVHITLSGSESLGK